MKIIRQQISKICSPERAKSSLRFFKTGAGDYGQGDKFVGLTNPQMREIAKEHYLIEMGEIQNLIDSDIHEERFIALVILDLKFKKKVNQEQIYQFYLKNIDRVNNWDLVDLSAPNIIGQYLLTRSDFTRKAEQKDVRYILYELALQKSLWRRRISILSTLSFIRKGHLDDTFQLSQILLKDEHDLMHKAVGWMLRQAGKRNQTKLEEFIQTNYDCMPRTMLRYSIQKFEETKRKKYLKKDFTNV